jgi:hypothetical protein
MRAPRALRRRRTPLMRQRAERLAQIQPTTSPYTLPAIGKQLAAQANRAGGAERFPDPAVPPRIAVDLARLNHDARLLTALALARVKTAPADNAPTGERLRAMPGSGKILARVVGSASHERPRFPRVQACVASGRLVERATEAAGTRDGPAGQKRGQADLTGAFSEAAVLFLRHHPAGQQYRARLTKQHGKGKALTVLAHKLARAVYYMLKRDMAFDLDKFLHE